MKPKKQYTAWTFSDRFRGNGRPYDKLPNEKEQIRTLGFTVPYNISVIIFLDVEVQKTSDLGRALFEKNGCHVTVAKF